MSEFKKVLVAEDELTNSIVLKRVLTKAGYSVVVAENGVDALQHLENEHFDALLTDWMMPEMDGIELIRRVRERIKPIPLIIMITALVSEGARSYAIESGSDDYIAKPIDVNELLTRLKDGIDRKEQEAPQRPSNIVVSDFEVLPPFVGVAIGTSTGGPPMLISIFQDMPVNTRAAFFIVQHGPSWMLETFSQRLQRETKLKVSLAMNNIVAEQGCIYIAPGDKHLRIQAGTLMLKLDTSPKENFVRPSVDPLFRSSSEAFGQYCIGVVLTGLGRDGTLGAAQIVANKGLVLVQDPETAVAPSMPRTVIEAGVKHKLVKTDELAKTISESVFPLASRLKQMQANGG